MAFFCGQMFVALLAVQPVVVIRCPGISYVADSDWQYDVWSMLSNATVAVEEVARESSSHGTLLEWRETVFCDSLLGRATHVPPPSNIVFAAGHIPSYCE